MVVIAAVPLLIGLVIAAVGVLGLRGRLPRNRYFGVRTSASVRTPETFLVANRVAGLPTLVGGAVGVLGGLAAILMPGTGGLVAGTLIGLVGMVAITVAAGVLGHRAAVAVAEPAETPGCGGCACAGACSRSVGAHVPGVGGQ